jgi:hypothetical protein
MRASIDPCEDSHPDDLVMASPVPPMTEWRTIGVFCGLSLNYVPSLRRYFLNHWEISYCMPLSVLFIIYSSLAVYLTCELAPLPDVFGWGTTLYLIITSILFGYSYIATILVGPGYLPFYYPLANPYHTRDDSLSGMVSNDEQLYYVKNVSLPTRVHFFKTARRIVVRPDHYCGWTETFIGKKNHKLFFLFNFWGVLYVSVFTVTSIMSVVHLVEHDELILQIIICIVYVMLGFSFAILTGSFVFSLLYGISINQTQFDAMEEKSSHDVVRARYRKGLIANWEEVFGSVNEWYLWLLPIPAFQPVNDRNMIGYRQPSEFHNFL